MYDKEAYIEEKIQEGRIIKKLKDNGILVKPNGIFVKDKARKLVVIYGRDYSVYDYDEGDFITDVSFSEYELLKKRRVKCIEETKSRDLPKIMWIKSNPSIINRLNLLSPGMFDMH